MYLGELTENGRNGGGGGVVELIGSLRNEDGDGDGDGNENATKQWA